MTKKEIGMKFAEICDKAYKERNESNESEPQKLNKYLTTISIAVQMMLTTKPED